tara:strand:+ start:373 stop:555 length:183 start_codon:yes stop_codon:yes gene_type:complete
MNPGDKLILVKKEGTSQSYLPYGSICSFICSFDVYICLEHQGKEMLIHKDLLEQLDDAAG